jgi:phage FluMu protein Com
MEQNFMGYLTDKEKNCKDCNRTWVGTEKVNIVSDGNVWIKFVECPKCKSVLVLDAIRYEEFPYIGVEK